jgi:ABC-2 type transport system permease protein
MRNVWLVLTHEIRTTIRRARFWIMTFIFPLFVLVLSTGSQVALESTISEELAQPPEQQTTAAGYVDQAGVIRALPEGMAAGIFTAYPSESAAREALAAGDIGEYYVMRADFLQTGEIVQVEAEWTFSEEQTSTAFEYLLYYNLTDNPQVAVYLTRGANVEGRALEAPTTPGPSTTGLQVVPLAALMIFFFVITMSSSMLLQSVTKEKENRTVEVLLVSLRPRQLMLGKVLGLGAVALLQMVLWLAGALFVVRQRPAWLGIAGSFELPPGFVVWSVLYFLFGYLVYASAMGAIGALAPNAKESSQFTFVVLLPLMIPLWLNYVLTAQPNSPLALFLSLFPLTAPVSMAARMVSVAVPVWQMLAGLAGLALTAYGFVALAGRFFRADTLLSDAGLSLERLMGEFRKGKA